MVTDLRLLQIRQEEYAHILEDSAVAQILAIEYDLQYDSVRGRLSRAYARNRATGDLKVAANHVPDIAPNVARQQAVITRSEQRWAAANVGDKRLAFVSDIHFPYTRWDAYRLMLEIINDFKPNFVTGMNDLRDNKGFSRWPDKRSMRGRLWSQDDSALLKMELDHYHTLHEMGILVPALAGNHDNWLYQSLRGEGNATAEREIASYHDKLERAGVLVFTDGYQENYLELSPSVVVWHGQFVQANSHTLAKKNLAHFMGVFNDGTARSVVAGHTHRPDVIAGEAVGYPGVQFVNSGALTDYTPYMKRAPTAHGLGITLIEYNTYNRHHVIDLVRFNEGTNRLSARWAGQTYSVPLDTSHPNEYR